MSKQLIECVPNFSEGRDLTIIKQITDAIEQVEGVQLLNVDPGKATNRTVVTFVGEPAAAIEAAFQAIKKAGELIDMRLHKGEHPRMGATDVCPLVPIANISMEETAKWATKLGERIGNELSIPIYLYEAAATRPDRQNLATIRAGEYEGFAEKIKNPNWKPDFGAAVFNPKSGATVVGARDFLIAYNVNLNTTSVRRANSVAFDVREQGRFVTDSNGKKILNPDGEPIRQAGACQAVKGIGWFIEEYGLAQVSMNLTNIRVTPLHIAFEECCKSATKRGMRVTGSELVGLVPKQVMLDAGKYFLTQQQRSVGVSEAELIRIAVKTMGLDELTPFDPKTRIIEYLLENEADSPLIRQNLTQFADETASESPAPGGGSIAAYVGSLGAALGAMVANLSSHKRGWDSRWAFFSEAAAEGQQLKDALLRKVDEDTQAFNGIMAAMQLPKATENDKANRKNALSAATRQAIETPLETMRLALKTFDLLDKMADSGNPNSISDVGVGALCARAAVVGAYLNVKINTSGFEDKKYVQTVLKEGETAVKLATKLEKAILEKVEKAIGG
ncbi:MAG: glutamate formimidoyltransferase [Bacteroidota bacterium]|jgi:glutamate formiminotransferase/formiminotetrahydrofolate cyclodeaminase